MKLWPSDNMKIRLTTVPRSWTAVEQTRSFTTAEGPRDAMPVKILSNVETSCTTKSTTNRSNGVRGLQLTDVK